MKAIYDPERDVLQVSFNPCLVEETTQIAPGLILDYDEDGNVVGLELRRASKKVDNPYEMTYSIGKSASNKPAAKS